MKDNEIIELLRPKVTILPEQGARWGNAKHILQSALDEWYKDFEPALRTTLQEQREEMVKVIEGMLRTNVYKLRKHSEPLSVHDITIPADYESAFRIGKEITLKDLLSHLTKESNNDKV